MIPGKTSKHKSQIPKSEAAQTAVACPFCASQDTCCENGFGTTHAYAQFFCRACRTPFEWIKWEEQPSVQDLPAFLKTASPQPVSLS